MFAVEPRFALRSPRPAEFCCAATVTSGCHTKDVAADSGTGDIALTNGKVHCPTLAIIRSKSVFSSKDVVYVLCSDSRLLLSQQHQCFTEHCTGFWYHVVCRNLLHSAIFR